MRFRAKAKIILKRKNQGKRCEGHEFSFESNLLPLFDCNIYKNHISSDTIPYPPLPKPKIRCKMEQKAYKIRTRSKIREKKQVDTFFCFDSY